MRREDDFSYPIVKTFEGTATQNRKAACKKKGALSTAGEMGVQRAFAGPGTTAVVSSWVGRREPPHLIRWINDFLILVADSVAARVAVELGAVEPVALAAALIEHPDAQ
jgi:hypothetical protein